MRTAELSESLIPLNQAIREEIPGEKYPSTTHRWITRGLAGLNGERIRLQVWYAGRQPCTTRASVRQFLTDVTAARLARLELSQQRDIVPAKRAVGMRFTELGFQKFTSNGVRYRGLLLRGSESLVDHPERTE